MVPMRPTRLLLLLSLLAATVLLVAAGRLLPAMPAGEGIYVSAAVTVLLGGLMIGSYAHFLNLTSWDRRRSAARRLPRGVVIALLLAVLGGLALIWPLEKSPEPVAADAGWYLHDDAADNALSGDATGDSAEIRVKFTSGQ